jgi:hypothetical protein
MGKLQFYSSRKPSVYYDLNPINHILMLVCSVALKIKDFLKALFFKAFKLNLMGSDFGSADFFTLIFFG